LISFCILAAWGKPEVAAAMYVCSFALDEIDGNLARWLGQSKLVQCTHYVDRLLHTVLEIEVFCDRPCPMISHVSIYSELDSFGSPMVPGSTLKKGIWSFFPEWYSLLIMSVFTMLGTKM